MTGDYSQWYWYWTASNENVQSLIHYQRIYLVLFCIYWKEIFFLRCISDVFPYLWQFLVPSSSFLLSSTCHTIALFLSHFWALFFAHYYLLRYDASVAVNAPHTTDALTRSERCRSSSCCSSSKGAFSTPLLGHFRFRWRNSNTRMCFVFYVLKEWGTSLGFTYA